MTDGQASHPQVGSKDPNMSVSVCDTLKSIAAHVADIIKPLCNQLAATVRLASNHRTSSSFPPRNGGAPRRYPAKLMGDFNVEPAHRSLATSNAILQHAWNPGVSGGGCLVRGESQPVTTSGTSIWQDTQHDFPVASQRCAAIDPTATGVAKSGSACPSTPGHTDAERGPAAVGCHTCDVIAGGGLPGVEDGESIRGSQRAEAREHRLPLPAPNRAGLGTAAKGQQKGPVSGGNGGGDRAWSHGPYLPLHLSRFAEIAKQSATDRDHDVSTRRDAEKEPDNEQVHGTLRQERSIVPPCNRGSEDRLGSAADLNTSQASGSTGVEQHHGTLSSGSQATRVVDRHTTCDKALVDPRVDFVRSLEQSRGFQRFRKKTILPVTPEEKAYPIHAKNIQPLDQTKLVLAVDRTKRRQVRDALSWVTSDEKWQKLCIQPRTKYADSDMMSHDLDTLLKRNFIEPTTKSAITRGGQLFTVLERDKMRRRPIFWPKQLNLELQQAHAPTPELPDVLDAIGDIRKGNTAITHDLACSFFQIKLSPDVRRFFGFRCGSRYYRMCVLPMGCTIAPYVMHSITDALASGFSATTRVHIDNIRFVGTPAEVEKASQSLVQRCVRSGVTLNEEAQNLAHQKGSFLGVDYNYDEKTISPTDKSKEKLRAALKLVVTPKTTALNVLHFAGIILWTSRILGVNLASRYYALKFFRRLASRLAAGRVQLSSEIAVWPSIISSLHEWSQKILDSPPVKAPEEDGPSEVVIATDASLTGWGAWMMCGSLWRETSGKWPQTHGHSEINELEARAVDKAIESFKEDIRGRRVLLLIDNSSTCAVLKKGHAHAFKLNSARNETLVRLNNLRPISVKVQQVESARNPADALSRGKTVDQRVASAVGPEGIGGAAKVRIGVPGV